MEEKLSSVLLADLARICDKPSWKQFIKYFLFPKGCTFPYIVWFRILQKCKHNKALKYSAGIIAYCMYSHFTNKYGIHANTNIYVGPGLRIVHRDGIYLNCKRIGSNFTVYQNCTLGSSSLKRNEEIPEVGNNVTIYTGAVVAGNIKLGNDCIVGANSFVGKSVDDNCFVAGVPAKVIRKKNEGMK